jgi:hypothetical protein
MHLTESMKSWVYLTENYKSSFRTNQMYWRLGDSDVKDFIEAVFNSAFGDIYHRYWYLFWRSDKLWPKDSELLGSNRNPEKCCLIHPAKKTYPSNIVEFTHIKPLLFFDYSPKSIYLFISGYVHNLYHSRSE